MSANEASAETKEPTTPNVPADPAPKKTSKPKGSKPTSPKKGKPASKPTVAKTVEKKEPKARTPRTYEGEALVRHRTNAKKGTADGPMVLFYLPRAFLPRIMDRTEKGLGSSFSDFARTSFENRGVRLPGVDVPYPRVVRGVRLPKKIVDEILSMERRKVFDLDRFIWAKLREKLGIA
jgi:hypothetical protein